MLALHHFFRPHSDVNFLIHPSKIKKGVQHLMHFLINPLDKARFNNRTAKTNPAQEVEGIKCRAVNMNELLLESKEIKPSKPLECFYPLTCTPSDRTLGGTLHLAWTVVDTK